MGFGLVLGCQRRGGGTKAPPGDQRHCDRGSSKLAYRQQSNPRPIPLGVEKYPENWVAKTANCTPPNGRDAAMIGQVRRVGGKFRSLTSAYTKDKGGLPVSALSL